MISKIHCFGVTLLVLWWYNEDIECFRGQILFQRCSFSTMQHRTCMDQVLEVGHLAQPHVSKAGSCWKLLWLPLTSQLDYSSLNCPRKCAYQVVTQAFISWKERWLVAPPKCQGSMGAFRHAGISQDRGVPIFPKDEAKGCHTASSNVMPFLLADVFTICVLEARCPRLGFAE